MSERKIMKELDVNLKLALSQEDIDDIMCWALEGGISYWCGRVKVEDRYLGKYAHEQISRGGKLLLWDFEDDLELCLDLDKLLNGIKLWAEDPVGCNCLEQVNNRLRIDCCNADEVVCDAIIQYALFGEIRYS